MYDEEFWNRRYAMDSYLYGTEPPHYSFLADYCDLLSGPVRCTAELSRKGR